MASEDAQADFSELSATVTRDLGDRLYEKRMRAADQVQKYTASTAKQNRLSEIKNLIVEIDERFLKARNAHLRKGGLAGLTAIVLGLGDAPTLMLDDILPRMLRMVTDADDRVRFYAVEALYNAAKMSQEHILSYFPMLFEAVCGVFHDEKKDVVEGAEALNKLLLDIVAEARDIDVRVDGLIPLLDKYARVNDCLVRANVLTWISRLESIPGIEPARFLYVFLDGMLIMASDTDEEIKQQALRTLEDFYEEVKSTDTVQFAKVVDTLSKHALRSSRTEAALVSIRWIHAFIDKGPQVAIPHAPLLLETLLPNVSSNNADIARNARRAATDLFELVRSKRANADAVALLQSSLAMSQSARAETRLEGIQWTQMLFNEFTTSLEPSLTKICPALLRTLRDSSELALRAGVDALSDISSHSDEHFQLFLRTLLAEFQSDRRVLQSRGNLILQRICSNLDPIGVFRRLAALLASETDLAFAREMVTVLNANLVTAEAMLPIRECLALSASSHDAADLFSALCRTWAHEPASLLALCLLSERYGLAAALIPRLSVCAFDVDFFVQLDRLVKFVETPAFTRLRLKLLEPAANVALLRTLYGILMILPQSTAFQTLSTRLASVHSLVLLQDRARDRETPINKAEASHIDQFTSLQKEHTRFRAAIRARKPEVESPPSKLASSPAK